MQEKNIQVELGQFLTLHKNEFPDTFTCEVKLVKYPKISFAFGSLEEQQLPELVKSTTGKYLKLFDTLGNTFTLKKPFDFLWVNSCKAYVCVCFYMERKHKTCYFINAERTNGMPSDYDKLQSHFYSIGKKSCRESALLEYSEFIIDLKARKVIKLKHD